MCSLVLLVFYTLWCVVGMTRQVAIDLRSTLRFFCQFYKTATTNRRNFPPGNQESVHFYLVLFYLNRHNPKKFFDFVHFWPAAGIFCTSSFLRASPISRNFPIFKFKICYSYAIDLKFGQAHHNIAKRNFS